MMEPTTRFGRWFDRVFMARYEPRDVELFNQVRTMLILLWGIFATILVAVVTTQSSLFQLGMLFSMMGVCLGFIWLIRRGVYRVTMPLVLLLQWVQVTALAYGRTPHFFYEVYFVAALYLFLLFVAALVIRKKTVYLFFGVISVGSLWWGYLVRGPLLKEVIGRFPDYDDYVVSTALIALSAFIVHYMVSRNSRLLQQVTEFRDHFLHMMDALPNVVFSVDEKGRVTHWNRFAADQTGISRTAAVGKPVAAVWPPMSAFEDDLQDALVHKQDRQVQHVRISTPQGERVFDLTITPLWGSSQRGAVVQVSDVTTVVGMEEALIQSEKMLSLGGLAAGMAHEINNPLGGLVQGLQVVEARLGQTLPANQGAAAKVGVDLKKMDAYLTERGVWRSIENMKSAGANAARIVQNMLQFARKSSSDKELTDLGKLVDDTLAILSNDFNVDSRYDFRKIEVQKEVVDDVPLVRLLPSMLQQVLVNLFKNAAMAITEKEIQAVEAAFAGRISIAISTQAQWVVVTISDNGVGMPANVSRRIFEPFFTTRKVGKGTGLGLAVSYFIVVEHHQGEMGVVSVPGEGTTFTIRLPR